MKLRLPPIEKTCPNCSGVYKTKASAPSAFCTKKCWLESVTTRKPKNCAVCSSVFFAAIGRADQRKYCSSACYQSTVGDRQRKPVVSKSCKECGNSFNLLYPKETRSLCSPECRKSVHSKRMIGNTFTLGEPGRDWWMAPASEVKTRLDYSNLHKYWRRKFGPADHCDFCGHLGKDRKYQWAVLNGKPDGNHANWSMLCTPCHVSYDRFINGRKFDNGLKEKARREKACAQCSTLFVVKAYQMAGRCERKYCSAACFHNRQRGRKRSEWKIKASQLNVPTC
jgi:hypothetical protein